MFVFNIPKIIIINFRSSYIMHWKYFLLNQMLNSVKSSEPHLLTTSRRQSASPRIAGHGVPAVEKYKYQDIKKNTCILCFPERKWMETFESYYRVRCRTWCKIPGLYTDSVLAQPRQQSLPDRIICISPSWLFFTRNFTCCTNSVSLEPWLTSTW